MENIKSLIDYFYVFLPQVLDGLAVTMEIFAITLALSLPLGIITALCRRSKLVIINKISAVYVLIMRGTPLLLQIIFIFFGLPTVGIVFDRFSAAIVAFTLNYGAYFGEIFRAGIANVDDGQYEAAEVLGLSKRETFIKIVLPQAIKNVLPPITNEVVTLVKDTSLVYILGLNELLKVGKSAVNRDSTLVPLFIVGIVYLIVIAVFSKIMARIEKSYDYYK